MRVSFLMTILIATVVSAQLGCSTMSMSSGPLSLMGPEPLPVTIAGVSVASITDADRMLVRRVHINAPQQDVFKYMVNFEAMPEWMPGLSAVSVDNSASHNGPGIVGVGTMRACTVPGAEVKETVVHYNEPHSFAYRMTEGNGLGLPFSQATGLVTLTPTRSGGTELAYHVFYNTKSLHPISPIAPTMLGKQLGDGLDNIATRLDGVKYK